MTRSQKRDMNRQQETMKSTLQYNQAMMGGGQGQFNPVPFGMSPKQTEFFKNAHMGATDPFAFNRANSAKFLENKAEEEADEDEFKEWEKQMRQANLTSAQANAARLSGGVSNIILGTATGGGGEGTMQIRSNQPQTEPKNRNPFTSNPFF